MTPSDLIDCPVVIESWNSMGILRPCSDSMSRGGRRRNEIIVVNRVSGDGSRVMVRTEFPHVRIIATTHHRGSTAAINQRLVVAANRPALRPDRDPQLVDPDTAVFGARVLDSDGPVPATGFSGLDRRPYQAWIPRLVAAVAWTRLLTLPVRRAQIFGRIGDHALDRHRLSRARMAAIDPNGSTITAIRLVAFALRRLATPRYCRVHEAPGAPT
jgi:hypothetical protein